MDFQFSNPLIATGVELIGLAIGVGLAIAAGALLSPKKTRNPNTRNNTAPTLAERGAYIPYVIGTARIGAVVAWMGKGKTKSKDEGGFLGFGTTKVKTTKQEAWHILCVGPVSKLNRIYEQGRIVYPFKGEPPLTPESHPNGTKVTLKSKSGAFRIYWGYLDNGPGDVTLYDPRKAADKQTGPGIESTWPNICHIVWDDKNLEVANQWPSLEYEVEVRPNVNRLFFSDPWINGEVIGLGPFMKNSGVNPGHALMQIMTDTYPHGVGIPQEQICGAFMENLGTVLQTEEQPVNMVIQEGEEAINPITEILKDVGAILPQCGDKIVPVLIRGVADEDIPILDDSVVCPDQPEKQFSFGTEKAERLIFVYKDRNLSFRDGDITIDNDSNVALGRQKARQIELNTVIDKDIAAKVADRRQQEDFTSVRGFILNASRGARILQPGQVFKNSRVGQVRVVAVERPDDSPYAKIECVSDVYSPNPTSYVPPEPPDVDPGLEGDPVPDILDWIEAPPPLVVDNALSLIVLRARGAEDCFASIINISRDGATFVNMNTLEAFFLRGTLDVSMTFDTAALSIDGFTITCDADLLFDADNFADLSLETTRWRAGEQVLVIGNEIMFFRRLTPITSTQFRVEGIIRGRLGSLQAAHTSGVPVWLAKREDLVPLSGDLVTRGTIYIQSLPIAGDIVLDPAEAPAVSHVFEGVSKAPYPPVTFRAESGAGEHRNQWTSGQPVVFKWANRSRFGNGSTAGTQLAGVAISAAPGMDGILQLEFKTTAGVLKKSVQVTSGETYSYPNADMVTDFSGEPSAFDVDFYQIDGSFPSIRQTIRITRR